MKLIFKLLLTMLFLCCRMQEPIESLPIKSNKIYEMANRNKHAVNHKAEVIDYLREFGYLEDFVESKNEYMTNEVEPVDASSHHHQVRGALWLFQFLMGFSPTGELNQETLDIMLMPRCGMSDTHEWQVDLSPFTYKKPNRLNFYSKRRPELTYRLNNYPSPSSEPSPAQINEALRQVFNMWSNSTIQFYFSEVKDKDEKADIDIDFVPKNHGDVYFQGSMIRETHFNHTFIMSAYESNQSHVAAYNMSHTYSSTYSEHKRSAIYHFYQTGFNVKLYPEDVATIQALYSSESSPSKSQELHAILKTGKAPSQSKWNHSDLTYQIYNYPQWFVGQSRSDVKTAIRRAFELWAQEAPLRFIQIYDPSQPVDINIRFKRGNHRKGPQTPLIHAYSPDEKPNGDIHFNNDIVWGVNESDSSSFNLYAVAAHGIGHSLGLKHSYFNRQSIMFPVHNQKNIALNSQDIIQIQRLNGSSLKPAK